jgi:hypothetical protein
MSTDPFIHNHALNKQAISLLKGGPQVPNLMPVLELAFLAIPEGKEDSDPAMWLESASRSNPKVILEILEEELPDGLPEDPMEAAEDILQALKPLDPYRDLR